MSPSLILNDPAFVGVAGAESVIYPDSCGATANGTVSGALVTTGGKFANALSFDGVDDYVSCGGVYDASGCGMNTKGTRPPRHTIRPSPSWDPQRRGLYGLSAYSIGDDWI